VDDGLSARAARTLLAAGLDPGRVAVLAGGIHAWHAAGLPIVRWDDPA
jgi:rhodanese-related sulfurtransferase